jgi:hypothetical protein
MSYIDKEKLQKDVESYKKHCDDKINEAYRKENVSAHIFWRGRKAAFEDFALMVEHASVLALDEEVLG